jgi:hypothetical protein
MVTTQEGTPPATPSPPPAPPLPVSRTRATAENTELLALRDAKWAIARGDRERARALLAGVKSPRSAKERKVLLEALGPP